jgi:hypothetical protein
MNTTGTLTSSVTPPNKSQAGETFVPKESLIPNWDEAEGTLARQRQEAEEEARIEGEARTRGEMDAQSPSRSRERVRFAGD